MHCFVIAIPAAWLAANKWLQNYPYRITLSWWMFTVAGIVGNIDCIDNGKLPGNKSGNCKPGEEFENGMIGER